MKNFQKIILLPIISLLLLTSLTSCENEEEVKTEKKIYPEVEILNV
jgi:uncharacterized lipoprotein YehR (DUF1307 family)